jgi:hypothetical protein
VRTTMDDVSVGLYVMVLTGSGVCYGVLGWVSAGSRYIDIGGLGLRVACRSMARENSQD